MAHYIYTRIYEYVPKLIDILLKLKLTNEWLYLIYYLSLLNQVTTKNAFMSSKYV